MNKMKIWVAAATIGALSLTALPALAQGFHGTGGPGGPGGRGGQRPDPVARLTTDLNLNAHQQAQIHNIFSSSMEQMRSFGRGPDARPKREALMKSVEAQVMQVLTPAQQNKLRNLGGLRGMMGRGGGGGRLERALGALTLTPAQKHKTDAILAGMRAKMEAMRSAGGTPDFSKMRAMSDSYKAEIEKVLTPEQRKKFEATIASMPQGRRGGSGGPGGPGGRA